MSIIEQAAQRLEQLRNAGVEVPAPAVAPTEDAVAAVQAAPTLERLAELEHWPMPGTENAAVARPKAPTQHSSTSRTPANESTRSKTVEIDFGPLAAAGFVTPEAKRAQIADEFRVVKRPIIKNAHDKSDAKVDRANLVMVTSALPREGKSFVALNLALSIASEVDSTVLLVDADVANPSLMRTLNLPRNSKGLLDLLTSDRVTLADVLLRTNVDKLTLLPAGTAHRRATEMLASETMTDLLADMASRYPDRIIVFDSPPLLATTEARVLASHMGQIVMVVEADRTTQAVVNRALETIESCPIVMMLLNKTARSEVGSYYGYGYEYGYGAEAEAT